MADTGWVQCSVGSQNGASGPAWDDPTQIQLDKGGSTQATLSNLTGTSQNLRGTGFDLSLIPAGSTIDGIEVRMSDATGGGTSKVDYIRLVDAGGPTGVTKNNDIDYSLAVFNTIEAGGPADTWSASLGWADVQSSAFGFEQGSKTTVLGPEIVQVAGYWIKITYTPPASTRERLVVVS